MIQTQTIINDYELALERIYHHRQKLFEEAQKSFNTHLLKQPSETEYYQFCDKLRTALDKAKKCRAKLDDHLKECQKLNAINRKLLPLLQEREQRLKLYKLLHGVIESVQMLESICPTVKRDYKKIPIDVLLTQIVTIRKQFYRIISAFNVFLQAKVDEFSPIYRYMYKLINLWKDRLEDLAEEMFVWSFELVRWPMITLEDMAQEKTSSDIKQLSLFAELFRCLLELQTSYFQFDDTTLEENLVGKLNLFQKPEEIKGHVPIKIMAVPLIKRFNFHFMNEQSKLNNIENVRKRSENFNKSIKKYFNK